MTMGKNWGRSGLYTNEYQVPHCLWSIHRAVNFSWYIPLNNANERSCTPYTILTLKGGTQTLEWRTCASVRKMVWYFVKKGGHSVQVLKNMGLSILTSENRGIFLIFNSKLINFKDVLPKLSNAKFWYFTQKIKKRWVIQCNLHWKGGSLCVRFDGGKHYQPIYGLKASNNGRIFV